jgi:hypothetical protein
MPAKRDKFSACRGATGFSRRALCWIADKARSAYRRGDHSLTLGQGHVQRQSERSCGLRRHDDVRHAVAVEISDGDGRRVALDRSADRVARRLREGAVPLVQDYSGSNGCSELCALRRRRLGRAALWRVTINQIWGSGDGHSCYRITAQPPAHDARS